MVLDCQAQYAPCVKEDKIRNLISKITYAELDQGFGDKQPCSHVNMSGQKNSQMSKSSLHTE